MKNVKNDTIICHDKKDAHRVLGEIGIQNVKDWEFLEEGKVKLILNCKIEELAAEGEKEND